MALASSAAAPVAAAGDAADEDVALCPRNASFSSMFYKPSKKCSRGTWAIRRRFGDGRQIFQFGRLGKSRNDLRPIVVSALGKLVAGESEADVKTWVLEETDRLL